MIYNVDFYIYKCLCISAQKTLNPAQCAQKGIFGIQG